MRPHIHTFTRTDTININTYAFNILMRSAILIAFCRLILICIEIHAALTHAHRTHKERNWFHFHFHFIVFYYVVDVHVAAVIMIS